jgi:hypothetical protein
MSPLRTMNALNVCLISTVLALLLGSFAVRPCYADTTPAITASTSQDGNPASNAFDGDSTTRWCAASGDFPQWIEADLGSTKTVAGVHIIWEIPAATYLGKIEGSADNKTWTTLADKTTGNGFGNDLITFDKPAQVRYVRVTITNATYTSYCWASMFECQIMVQNGDKSTPWKPAPPAPANQ